MQFDPVLLSRIQFAWVIGWHILLPAFTVGAASFIAVVEGLSLATGREVYVRISTFWTKIFAIAFGMGVVTGIIMPFQFGTNWSPRSPTSSRRYLHMRALRLSFWKPVSSASCCSAASWCRRGPTSSRP
jgi:Cytochrome bd terminal oxidase subunit I